MNSNYCRVMLAVLSLSLLVSTPSACLLHAKEKGVETGERGYTYNRLGAATTYNGYLYFSENNMPLH